MKNLARKMKKIVLICCFMLLSFIQVQLGCSQDVLKDGVFIVTQGTAVTAYSLENQDVLWTANTGLSSASSLIIADKTNKIKAIESN